MIINVKVVPKASQERVETIDSNSYKVWVTKPAQKGLANKAVIDCMAKYLSIRKGAISIKKGLRSKEKVLEILPMLK